MTSGRALRGPAAALSTRFNRKEARRGRVRPVRQRQPWHLMMLPPGLVDSLRYKPGWTFKIAGPLGSMLCIYATTPDSQNPGRDRITQHQFTIPDFETDGRTPIRWVFDCLLLCELHEAGEFFQVADERPFFPHHQDEGSPYELVDRSEQPCP